MSLIYKKILPSMEILDCTDSFDFKSHIHDRYVVWLNTGCGELFNVKGENSVLQTGSIGIFEPGLVHANEACSGGRRHLRSYYISAEFFENLALRYKLAREELHFKNYQINDPGIWKRLGQLHDYMMANHPNLEMDTHLLETFLLLIKRHSGRGTKTFKDTCDKRIRETIDFFHANIDEPIRLKKIAGIAGCTEYHLIRLFRDHMGMPPHAYLLQIRLEKARRMIQEGSSIAVASHAAGFSDQSHLTRKFKLRYGLTPRAYVKQCQFCSRF